jgi:membrane-associated phospholipid phosphatase
LGLLFALSRHMLRLGCGAAVSLALAMARSAGSQTLGPERRDIGDLRGDVWAVWSSPVHATARDLIPTAAVLGAVTLTSYADSSIYVWMSTHPNTLAMRVISPIRDGWKFPINGGGNGQFLLPLSATLYLAGRLSHDVSLRDAGLGCAAGHLTSAALRDVIYLSVSRMRPHDTAKARQMSVPGGRVWGRHSFLSGHIANSMSCVSYFAHRFSLGAAEPVMYAYPIMIGLGRMADGWHWTSDTMAGAAMGFAIGKAMSDRQSARVASRAVARSPSPLSRVSAAPIRIPFWSFRF